MYSTTFCVIFFLLLGKALASSAEDEIFKNYVAELQANGIVQKMGAYCNVTTDPLTDASTKKKTEESMRLVFRKYILDCQHPDGQRCPTLEDLQVEDPCTSPSTVNLAEAWRKDHNAAKLRPLNGSFACDRELQSNNIWFRFTGAAGNQLLNKCPPMYSCGAHGGFWSDAEMPTKAGEIKFVPIYGSLNGNCDWYTWTYPNPLTVRRCSSKPGDFVYKVDGTGHCWWAFCGMDSMESLLK